MDDLQKEIDATLKKAVSNKNAVGKDDIADIILKPEDTELKQVSKDTEKTFVPKNKDIAEKKENPQQPRSIAQLLASEAAVAKNPPRAPRPTDTAKIKENLKDITYTPKSESPTVQKIRTLKGDIEEAMRSGKATLVSMAAAEFSRAEKTPAPTPTQKTTESGTPITNVMPRQGIPTQAPKNSSSRTVTIISIFISVLLIGAGAGAVYFLNQEQSSPIPVVSSTTPVIVPVQFDSRIDIADHNASYLRAAFAALLRSSKGNLNDIGSVHFTVADKNSPTGSRPLTTAEFFTVFGMHTPPEIARTLEADFVLGIHRFPTNQAFIVFKTDSYDSAYAGALNWEKDLEGDLGTFLRSPSDFAYASSTDAINNRRAFKDAVIKNNDARAIYNDKGDLLFFYTFLKDRRTLVMATNAETLGQLLSALSSRKVTK